MLHIPGGSEMFFCCKSCPYRHPLHQEVRYPLKLETKKVDDILGGAEAWANVDKVQVVCGKCRHNEAFFVEFQTRSADEPATIFYKCANLQCNHRWKEG